MLRRMVNEEGSGAHPRRLRTPPFDRGTLAADPRGEPSTTSAAAGPGSFKGLQNPLGRAASKVAQAPDGCLYPPAATVSARS